MKGLKTLVLMQLKDKLDFSFLKSVKQTIFKVVLFILKFAVATALMYFIFYALTTLRLVSILPGIPENFLTVVFTVMFLLSIVVCTFGLMKSLYFSKDNAFLLTMPTDRVMVFSSKLIVYYIYELVRNLTYILPLFAAYGLVNHLPVYYYFWVLLVMPLITAIPVVSGALFSIIAMYLTNFVKSYKWLEYSLLIIFIGGIALGLVLLINAIPKNLDLIGTWGTTFWQIQSFMTGFVQIFAPFAWIVTAVIGERYGISNNMFIGEQFIALAGIILAIALIIVLTYLIVRPLFFKMVSSPFEYRKKKIKNKRRNQKNNYFVSSVKKDLLLSYRTSEKLYGLLFIIIGMPIAIFLLNKLYAAMDTRLTGAYMTMAFNILIILLFALSSNTNLSHIYSEEGASSYLLKTFPNSYIKTVFSKLIVNIVSVCISLLVSLLIFASFAKLSILNTILIYLMLVCTYIAHALWCAETDIMNPQTLQYQTTGGHVNNPNEVKAVITAMLMSALMAFLTFFFMPENDKIVWWKLLFIAAMFLALRVWLYINKVRVYYKERQ